MCSMMPATSTVRPVGDGVDIDLDGVLQIAVDQNRVRPRDADRVADVAAAVRQLSWTISIARPPRT